MELQVLEQNVIVQAFQTQGGTDALFERIAEQARSFVPDVTTRKGREEIGSVAMKVSKSKTLTEKYAKDLVAEEKARIKLIDDDRIQFCKKMDSLRDEILAPRDAWEQAEKDRVKKHEDAIESIKNNACYYIDTTLVELKQSLVFAEQVIVDESFEEYQEQAKIAKYEAIELLRAAVANREKYEAEQSELERLRQAEIERQQKERDEKIAREAADKARVEAEAKAQAEANRIERERKEAAEKAEREKLEAEQREARLKAEKEAAELREQQLKQQAIEREKQAEIDRQNAVEAERKRIEQEAQAKAEAERKEQAAREANKAHKRKICNEALQGLTSIGVSEELGKQILQAIHKGEVPHVSIKF